MTMQEMEEEKVTRRMISNLSPSELETAAKTSYRYFTTQESTIRESMAVDMARRYLVAEKGDETLALNKMIATIKYREEMNVDALRRCCYDDGDEKMKAIMERELATPYTFIRGYDKQNRVCFQATIDQKDPPFHPRDFIMLHIYMAERANACVEKKNWNSDQTNDKWCVIIDYNGFTLSKAPPLSISKAIINLLQHHYPERMAVCYAVDAPLAFRVFWKLIQPFIDPVTKSKIVFVTGEAQKRKVLSSVLNEDQALPRVLPEGKLTNPLDVKKFLFGTPFDQAYEE